MVSAVRSRPNHYEVLGVGPAASAEEIKRAFQRKMSLFGAHLMAEAPQISVAYETLRNPAKRRDYDRTLGLNVGPKPHAWGFTVAPPRWMPLAAAPLDSAAATPEPHVETGPQSSVDPRAAAISASLRELSRPSQPAAQRPAQRAPEPDMEPLVDLYERIGKERSFELRQPWFAWKKPVMAAGGLLIGAGLIGAFAGLSVKDNAASAKAEPALAVALPEAKVPANAEQPAAGDAQTFIASEASPAAAAPARRRIPPPQRPTGSKTAWAETMAKSLSADAETTAPAVEEAAAADSPPAEVVPASLPISKSVIAKTIERIGYSCGDVSSTAPGSSGGFIVTCTSGGVYQAKPVRGRYHFRRVAG